MELEKNGVREKSFLGVLVFGHPYCSSTDSTQFNFEHENTCSIACHIGSSFPTFQDMCLHVTVRKKKLFYNFLYKIHHIYKKIKFLRKTTLKTVFILLLYYTSTEKLHGNALSKKERLQYFSN